jgi:hypothetical protein
MDTEVGERSVAKRLKYAFGIGRGRYWRTEERRIGSSRVRETLARYTGAGAGITVTATASVNRLDVLPAPKFEVDDGSDRKASVI